MPGPVRVIAFRRAPRARRVVVALAAVVAVAVAATACIPRFGRTEPAPDALVRYLDALVAGEFDDAYARTQLGALRRQAAGGSLSPDHFAAFHRANRLQRYSFARVTRLNRVSIDQPDRGTPSFDVDVDLVYADGSRRENFGVEGEVLGTVQVDPDPVRLLLEGDPDVVEVDGIETPLGSAPTRVLLLLRGRHVLEAAGVEPVTFTTEPLAVLEGPGRVVDDPEKGRSLAIG